jgi:hypothetical protein
MPTELPVPSSDSTELLPMKGYSMDQLCRYIQRQLGSPVWNVEYTKQQIMDNIQTALTHYSLWCPRIGYAAVQLDAGQHAYLQGVDVGQGIADVAFVQRTPVPTQLLWSSLIGVNPIPFSGLDELDGFTRWLKTFMRVTSARPDWQYDEVRKVLYIHNPMPYYHCAVTWYGNYEKTELLNNYGALMVRDLAFQLARHGYAELLQKFSGAIPGPVQNLTLDNSKREAAKVEIDRLLAKLEASQCIPCISID